MVHRLISTPQAFDVIAALNFCRRAGRSWWHATRLARRIGFVATIVYDGGEHVQAKSSKAGWVYPGDIGALGKNGFLHLFARPHETARLTYGL